MNERKPLLNILVSRLLLGWITAGVVFLLIGLVWAVITTLTTGDPLPGVGQVNELRRVDRLTLAQIVQGLSRLQPEAFINVGVLLILLTPVVRVVTLSVYFLTTGDRKYGLISLTTFLILLMDFMFALR